MAGSSLTGKRIPDLEGAVHIPPDVEPGDFWLYRLDEHWPYEWWALLPGEVEPSPLGGHEITEEPDGTITIEGEVRARPLEVGVLPGGDGGPERFIAEGDHEGWVGQLRRGVWEES